MNLDIVFSIFANNLIKIQLIKEPDRFLYHIYEACIKQAEIKYSKEENKNTNFIKTDLSDREKGSNDLIIMQYFLKKEGTFLQYL